MAVRKIAIGTLLALCAAPASASVIVIGNSDARLCYEAADSPLLPLAREMERCNDALAVGGLSNYDTVATHVNRGILRLRRGLIDQAIVDFDAAIQLDPNQPEAYLNKGAALIQRRNPSEAAQLFTVALERNTQRPAIAHYGRAVANEELGNIREAYQDYQMASQLAPHWEAPRADLLRFRVVQH